MKDRAGMKDKRETTVEENVFMFIQHGLCGISNRGTQELQQRSASTISAALHEVANGILSIGTYFIPGPPSHRRKPHDFIANNDKFAHYFGDFDGAVDGTHIPASISPSEQGVWRDYKNDITQNCLVYFGYNLEVYFLLAGFEGSAHDARLLNTALKSGTFPRQGKKFVDAAFKQTTEFIKPYPSTRYHLKEWGSDDERPQNFKELFNLRHAMCRNCAERGMGVVKKRFPILRNMLHFDIDLQVKLVQCAFCLHNFIHRHDHYEPDEFDELSSEEMNAIIQEAIKHADNERDTAEGFDEEEEEEEEEMMNDEDVVETADEWRDRIAQEMWDQYQEELRNRSDT